MELSWAVLPIFRGALKGAKWLIATRSNFFFGTYEPEQTSLFAESVKPGAVVFDIGAHFGYYSVLSSRLAGPAGRVIAFEPSPANLKKLRRHLELNHCTNTQILELALSDKEGTARFETRVGSGVGHLSNEGSIEVKVSTLDSIVAQLGVLPTVMKIDVEGAEMSVFDGGHDTLERARPTIFLSLHGEELKQEAYSRLRKMNYNIREILPMEIVATPRK